MDLDVRTLKMPSKQNIVYSDHISKPSETPVAEQPRKIPVEAQKPK